MGKQQKIVLPPDLPPDVPDDEVEVSDEDFKFVSKRKDYAGFLSKLDTKSITKHVTRVADVKEDALEAMYERRSRKKSVEKEKEANEIEVDPVDALPVKTLDGKLYYRSAPKSLPKHDNEATIDVEDNEAGATVTKLTKPEKRAKLKKEKKEAKKQAKAVTQSVEVELPSKAELLDEVKKELTAEEAKEKNKENKIYRLAELGTALLVDPESNIKSLKDMLEISKDGDHDIVILGLKSMLAVFKDIIPGYRIRLPTEKEQEMMVSKDVKKMRLYEYTLLSSYKAYIQKLISVENQAIYKRVAVRCLCTLLEAVPHFNFRETLVGAVVRNISSPDDVVRKHCCDTVKSLFLNEGKHGGEATFEAVRMIADLVKAYDCQLHPDSVEVFMSLSFDEDLVKASKEEKNSKSKSSKKKRKFEDEKKVLENDKKRSKKEMISRTREEVKSDYKAASFAQDIAEKGKLQTITLSAVFQTFFRILKHAMQPRSESKTDNSYGKHPLLAPCLNGIGRLSHLIDLDFMPDLMNHLKKLAESGHTFDVGSFANFSQPLTVSERLQCCIVAFKVMKTNLDALNVDLQDFYVQLYRLILEYRPGRDKGEILAEALKIMLCDGRLHDMQRAAAFIKRLATFSLCFGSAESLAALVTLNHLLLKNTKCRNLLENDEGGGSVICGIAKYQPYASDPNLSGALGSVLWELNLLSKHYHPDISKLATGISTMNTANNEVFHSNFSPQQAFKKLWLEQESFIMPNVIKVGNTKRKKGSSSLGSGISEKVDMIIDSDKIAGKLSDHFLVVEEVVENERLRSELDQIKLKLNLCKEFKKLQKRKSK